MLVHSNAAPYLEGLRRILCMEMPLSLLQADLSRDGAQYAVALQPVVAKDCVAPLAL
jgi:hypothetical protein